MNFSAGYAEFPDDSADLMHLEEYAVRALAVAKTTGENKLVGYFTERRRFKRILIQIPVQYYAPGNIKHLTCSRNISKGGIMLSGLPDLSLGNNIRLGFSLPAPYSLYQRKATRQLPVFYVALMHFIS